MRPVDEGPKAGRAVLKLLEESGREMERMELCAVVGGRNGAAVQRWESQGLSSHEYDVDVKKTWKLAPNFQSEWVIRWGYLTVKGLECRKMTLYLERLS